MLSLSKPNLTLTPGKTVFFNYITLDISPVPTKLENYDDIGHTDTALFSCPSSNVYLDHKAPLAMKIFSNIVYLNSQKNMALLYWEYTHLQILKLALLLKKTPSYVPNYHKIHPHSMSSNMEVSLSDTEYSLYIYHYHLLTT